MTPRATITEHSLPMTQRGRATVIEYSLPITSRGRANKPKQTAHKPETKKQINQLPTPSPTSPPPHSLTHLPYKGIIMPELKYTEASLGGSVGCAVQLETRRSQVQPPPRSATFFRGD